jgi:hypothetical protein
MWERLSIALSQSADRVIGRVADFLPGVLALTIAVILSIPIAWLVSRLLRRSLRGVKFDERLEQWGFTMPAEWSPSRSPSLLVGRIAYWTIVILGLLVGVTALDAELTSNLAMRAIDYLPNVFVAGAVFFFGSLIARFVARGVLISAVNMQIDSARLISVGVKWLILVCAAAMALEHLGIGGSIVHVAFAILFGGIVLALALATGLGSKDAVARAWERHREKAGDNSARPFQHL